MANEFGYLFEMDIPQKSEYYDTNEEYECLRLNSARSAIVIAAKCKSPKSIYVPVYICDCVIKALELNGFSVIKYGLNEVLEPDIEYIDNDDILLFVNYFGNCLRERIVHIAKKYRNVIIDNSQAFYSTPVLMEGVYNVYSPRKFFGVSDGGYLLWKGEAPEGLDIETDSSWKRASYLLKCVEEGSNYSYADFLNSEEDIGYEIKQMSTLTRKILAGIDYEKKRALRIRNLQIIKEELKSYNDIPIAINEYPLMCYPLYKEDPGMREYLIDNKVYVPQWWKYILGETDADSVEARFSNWLFPIPIDHRQSEKDMYYIVDLIKRRLDSDINR